MPDTPRTPELDQDACIVGTGPERPAIKQPLTTEQVMDRIAYLAELDAMARRVMELEKELVTVRAAWKKDSHDDLGIRVALRAERDKLATQLQLESAQSSDLAMYNLALQRSNNELAAQVEELEGQRFCTDCGSKQTERQSEFDLGCPCGGGFMTAEGAVRQVLSRWAESNVANATLRKELEQLANEASGFLSLAWDQPGPGFTNCKVLERKIKSANNLLTKKTCIGGNPACPCNDGDPCNYKDHEGTKGFPIPVSEVDALQTKLAEAEEYERQRAVEICDLVLDRMIDRERCAKALRDSETKHPSMARKLLAEGKAEICPACAGGQCDRCAKDNICECECRANRGGDE